MSDGVASSYKTTLDRFERAEKLALLRRIGLVVSVAALFLVPLIPTRTVDVAGTVTALHADSDDERIWHVAVVQLDAGPVVRAGFYGAVRPKPGQRVMLAETNRLFMLKHYQVTTIIEERHPVEGVLQPVS